MIYSHSRLSTFEQCAFKFKLRYLDKIIPEIEKSIEAHLGSVVHTVLELLYLERKKGNILTLDDLILYYHKKWEEEFHKDIKIVRKQLTAKDYFNKGVIFLINYYTKNHPFDDGTLEIEKKIVIDLDKSGKYKLQGFIDRFVFNEKTGAYEIHDYKTANSLPNKNKIENDRQLALYSIGIKESVGYEKDVNLVWHYLAHNQKIQSRRTNEQLELLKEEIIALIDEVESTTEFLPQKSILCDWCEYKSMCPMFGGVINERQDKLESIKSNQNILILENEKLKEINKSNKNESKNVKEFESILEE